MIYQSIVCDSLLKKITKKDELFGGTYTLDPYHYCEFGCQYCDSSSEKTISIKSNAVDLLKKEIKDLEKGVIIIGSVHDPYQNAEETYTLTRDILKIIKTYDFPCHILTKSTLVLRDLDIISELNHCAVTLSIISLNEIVSHLLEGNTPSPKDRLQTVQALSEQGIATGIALIPVLPYIVDNELEDIVRSASFHHAQYCVHKYLELKGDQKRCFQELIATQYPQHVENYRTLYQHSLLPQAPYIAELDKTMSGYCKKYGVSEHVF